MRFNVGDRVKFDWHAEDDAHDDEYVSDHLSGEGEVTRINEGFLASLGFVYHVEFDVNTVVSDDPEDKRPGVSGDFTEIELDSA